MTLFSGLYFYVTLFVFLIPAVILGTKGKSLRLYRDILTMFYIAGVFSGNMRNFIYFVCYIALSMYVVKIFLFLCDYYGKSAFVCGNCILIVIFPLLVMKFGIYCEIKGFGFLGLSYICFRVIQVILEIYDGLITQVNVISFVEFLTFFPALSSGPIDRSRRFEEDNTTVIAKDEYVTLLGDGLSKILLGMFYKFACAGYCYSLASKWMEMAESDFNLPLYVIAYSYAYGLYLFFDFAGYSAMAIGTAYILGIRLPENFNMPFAAVDMKDFWNRWHITLSHWFRDFIFTRFVMHAIKKRQYSNIMHAAVAGYIVNMGIMGIWHGVGWSYLLYGLYHGVLLALTEIYQKQSTLYKKYKDYSLYKIASWFVTLNFVMFGFFIFSGHFGTIVKFILVKF